MILAALMLTQGMGCASKIKTFQGLKDGKLNPDFNYKVKFNTGYEFKDIPGEQLSVSQGNLVVNKDDDLVAYRGGDILHIEGTSKQRQGSYALMGMGIGAAVGGVVTSIILGVLAVQENNESSTDGPVPTSLGAVIGFGAGALGGGVFGLGIGALIPKTKKLRIVPIVPTSKGATTGLSISTTF